MPTSPSLLSALLFPALAGGLAWGIRGQYGHESGAMLAGLLVSLVLTLLYCPAAPSLFAFRAVAWCTIAMGIGGSETYGQTIGLTQDAPLIGHWDALAWGMLGLAIKGGLWIGFAGTLLGMGLGGKRYHHGELPLVLLAMIGLSLVGIWLFNQPFEPSQKVLPWLYFSDDWYWEPDTVLKPRREAWGGMALALGGLLSYVTCVRRDGLAWRMGLWGLLGGALGFPGGQCIQAFHAWNPSLFQGGVWTWLAPLMNWWNCMETAFGLILGGTLGLGLWLHQRRIKPPEASPPVTLHVAVEWLLVVVHVFLLTCSEFNVSEYVGRGWGRLYASGLAMAIIPLAGVASGRWWPYLLALPITALPIAGKTLRKLAYENGDIALVPGWLCYLILPLTLTLAVAVWLALRSRRDVLARTELRLALLLTTWLYLSLNFGFFQFPWPWQPWTSRTPNALIFALCALGLTVCALWYGRSRRGAGVDRDPEVTGETLDHAL